VSRIDDLAADARRRGIKPWLAVKEVLAECAVLAMAGDERAVLQGGAALHFAYGSPRLSADVDFVGESVGESLSERGEEIARRAGEIAGMPATWSLRRDGRLVRGKVTIQFDAARRLVLPVEAYEVPAHHPLTDRRLGRVEAAQEIAADKIVASADRLARRGTIKTRDLYDLWFIRTRLGSGLPDQALIAMKLRDYGQPVRGADLAAAARSVSPEEMRMALDGVLPTSESASTDPSEILDAAADWLGRYRNVL
jgi:hypothetical protein